jgi:hypothetical protein
MRTDLDHLTDRTWLYAVSIARRREWFPSIEALLEYAAECPPPLRLALPGERVPKPGDERADARAGLQLIEAVLRSKGIEVKRPEGMPPLADTPARRAELRAQAAQVMGGKA